jgi:uncharacterized small protein (DUF1192 family)
MDFDELEPRAKPAKPRDLSSYSVEEMKEYIARMQAEIARVEAALAAKQSYRSSADAFFKK